jgi:hypothetical protein
MRIALWRERRHTEKLLKEQLFAITAEIRTLKDDLAAKLESVDTSASLIAGELARRNNDLPSKGNGT